MILSWKNWQFLIDYKISEIQKNCLSQNPPPYSSGCIGKGPAGRVKSLHMWIVWFHKEILERLSCTWKYVNTNRISLSSLKGKNMWGQVHLHTWTYRWYFEINVWYKLETWVWSMEMGHRPLPYWILPILNFQSLFCD